MLALWHNFMDMMTRGGIVMWPILAMSIVAVAVIIERSWFFIRTNRPARIRRVQLIAHLLRTGDHQRARQLADSDDSVYGEVVVRLFNEPPGEAAVVEAIEEVRRPLERFMSTLSTIITAAPMLGILGTVLGIIASFQILSTQIASGNPRSVSGGIAEALITTAAGLVVAIGSLFPYNIFRAQVDRTLSRLESLGAATLEGRDPSDTPTTFSREAKRSAVASPAGKSTNE